MPVGYTDIVGKFTRAVVDGPDSGRDPDRVPIEGLQFEFVADLKPAIARDTAAKETVYLEPIPATTDENGVLIGPDGLPGIRLTASDSPDLEPNGWTYTVTTKGAGLPTVKTTFVTESGATLDFSDIIAVPPNPGNQIPAWTAVVSQATSAATIATEAKEEAVAAAESVQRDQPNGVAPLGSDGKLPEPKLPSRLSEAGLSATMVKSITDRAATLNLRPDSVFMAASRNTVMAAPPTVTEGAAATITGQVVNVRTDARIRSLSGVLTLSPDGNWIQTRGPRKTDGSFDAGTPDYWNSIEFMVDAAAIEFRLLGLANKYVLTVDGERHSATNGAVANTSASRYLKFDFGGRKADGTARRVQLSVQQGQLREINLAATDTLFAVQTRPAPKLAVLGDSLATGFATRAMVSIYDGYVQQLGRLLGLTAVNQNAASNTGFLAANGATAGTYASRVQDIIALAPEVVLVQGSINDYQQTASAVGAAAAEVFAALKAALPGSVLIATGILDVRVQSQQGTSAAQNAAIKAAAEANGFFYVETGGWVTGNGYAGATTGQGNSDVYTHSDQTHYTTRGGLYFASRLAGAIRAAVPQLA